MIFFIFNTLTTKQLKSINDLCIHCTNYDNILYDCFSENDIADFDLFILSYNEHTLTGFLMYSNIGDTNELRGMVHPDYRRQGIFSNMFRTLKSKLNFDDVIFVGKDNYPGMSECASSLGYKYCYHDFLMEFSSELFTPGESADLDVEFDETYNKYYYYLDDDFIGSCTIYEEESTINIYEVFVEPLYRNQGYGHQIISDVLWDLVNSRKNIRLHVTENNTPAMKLYISCGFEIKDSIVYYASPKHIIKDI